MIRFRKKPVEIEAVQFDGTARRAAELVQWSGLPSPFVIDPETCGSHVVLHVNTLEGLMRANSGDWIIQGVAGEFYPCRDDIFRATYKPVES